MSTPAPKELRSCLIGLGSSVGDRRAHIERAVAALGALSTGGLRVSPLYETLAVLPEGALPEWDVPYLNGVAQIDWHGTARDLLQRLKDLERELGRLPAPRGAPRPIDLDLLIFGNERIEEEGLRVPHPEMAHREFVRRPLRDLVPELEASL